MYCSWSFALATISPEDDDHVVAGSPYDAVICNILDGGTVTEWLRDGTVLDVNNDDRLSVIDIGNTGQFYRLIIANIQQSDSGRYQCRTSSDQLSPLSGYVNVLGKCY